MVEASPLPEYQPLTAEIEAQLLQSETDIADRMKLHNFEYIVLELQRQEVTIEWLKTQVTRLLPQS